MQTSASKPQGHDQVNIEEGQLFGSSDTSSDSPDPVGVGVGETATVPAVRDETADRSWTLILFQVLRCKGATEVSTVAGVTCLPESVVSQRLSMLCARGECVRLGQRVRLTPAGRDRLVALLAAERQSLDLAALRTLDAEFTLTDAELKALLTEWQRSPTDFDDFTVRFGELHRRALMLLERLTVVVPRLALYVRRLAYAAERIAVGDRTWLASPMCDSYHTVWFELHQEVMDLIGVNRATRESAQEVT